MTSLHIRLAALVALGCSTSHPADDAATHTVDDAATHTVADAATPIDAWRPRASACRGEFTDTTAGGGCFCQGPFARAGDIVYRATHELEVIDVSDPSAPRLITTRPLALPSSDGTVVRAGDAIVVAGTGIEVFTIADPSAPESRRAIPLEKGWQAYGGASDGSFAFIATGFGFRERGEILAINPASPILIAGRAEISGQPGDVAFANGYIYAGAREGTGASESDRVWIVDVSSPREPEVVDSIIVTARAAFSPTLAVSGSTLWVAGHTPLLEAYDLETPSAPSFLSALDGEAYLNGIAASGDLVFLLGNPIHIVDGSDPRAPRIVGTFDSPGDNQHAELIGESLLVSNGNTLRSASIACDRE